MANVTLSYQVEHEDEVRRPKKREREKSIEKRNGKENFSFPRKNLRSPRAGPALIFFSLFKKKKKKNSQHQGRLLDELVSLARTASAADAAAT